MTPSRPAATTPRVLVGAALSLVLVGACSPAGPSPSAVSGYAASPVTTAPTGPTPSSTTTTATPSPDATATPAPPFVGSATWVRGSGGRSLHVVPTAAGRAAQGAGDAAEAWSEVLRLAPDADQPGMRDQFDCHWTYARLVAPDKPSWNLEPWRPVVSADQLVQARCNPGGPETADE